jgi:hypothetical protein
MYERRSRGGLCRGSGAPRVSSSVQRDLPRFIEQAGGPAMAGHRPGPSGTVAARSRSPWASRDACTGGGSSRGIAMTFVDRGVMVEGVLSPTTYRPCRLPTGREKPGVGGSLTSLSEHVVDHAAARTKAVRRVPELAPFAGCPLSSHGWLVMESGRVCASWDSGARVGT